MALVEILIACVGRVSYREGDERDAVSHLEKVLCGVCVRVQPYDHGHAGRRVAYNDVLVRLYWL